MKAIGLAAVLLGASLALALAATAEGPREGALAECASGPPCGYIMPNLELEFPDKPKCPGAPGSIDASACIALPADGGASSFTGSVIWSWKESEDLSYPSDPQQDIKITFGGTAMNPLWLPFKFEPESYTITAADLADPNNRKVDSSSGTPVVYYWYERPVKVTFERNGGPNADEMDRFVSWEGVQSVYAKAKSTASGAFYKEAFGGEEFRFDARSLLPAEDSQEEGYQESSQAEPVGGASAGSGSQGQPAQAAPVGGLLSGVLALAAVGTARRRRAP